MLTLRSLDILIHIVDVVLKLRSKPFIHQLQKCRGTIMIMISLFNWFPKARGRKHLLSFNCCVYLWCCSPSTGMLRPDEDASEIWGEIRGEGTRAALTYGFRESSIKAPVPCSIWSLWRVVLVCGLPRSCEMFSFEPDTFLAHPHCVLSPCSKYFPDLTPPILLVSPKGHIRSVFSRSLKTSLQRGLTLVQACQHETRMGCCFENSRF